MERAVEHRRAEIHHRVARQEAAQPRVLHALFDRRDELPRDRAAEDVVHELEVAAARKRLELDLAVAELAVAAGLLLVAAVRFGRRGDRLAIRNPRQLQVDLDAEPPLQLRDRHLDVRLSLPGEQQLLRLRVAVVADARILFLQPVQRRADLLLVAAALRLDRVRDDRLGELDRRDRDLRRSCRPADRSSASPSAWRRRRGRPALISGTVVCVLPWSRTRCPSRSGVSLVTLCTVESALSVPGHDAEQRDAAGERIRDRLPDERRRRAPSPSPRSRVIFAEP